MKREVKIYRKVLKAHIVSKIVNAEDLREYKIQTTILSSDSNNIEAKF